MGGVAVIATWTFALIVYVLPLVAGFFVAFRKDAALALALTAGTLFLSWVLVALYVTMLLGFLLPWVLLCYAVFGMRRPRGS